MLKTRNILDITNPKNQKVLRLYAGRIVSTPSQVDVAFTGDYMSFRYFKYGMGQGIVPDIYNKEYYVTASDSFYIWPRAMDGEYFQFGYIIARGDINSISIDVEWEPFITYP